MAKSSGSKRRQRPTAKRPMAKAKRPAAKAAIKRSAKRKPAATARNSAPRIDALPRGKRELIVVKRTMTPEGAPPFALAVERPSNMRRLLERRGATMAPLFAEDPLRGIGLEAAAGHALAAAPPDVGTPNLARYQKVEAPDKDLDGLAEQLRADPTIEAAYVMPAPAPALLNAMTPSAAPAPPRTPDYSADQIYLNPTPAGVDARFAWSRPGGGGANISIIDIEGDWQFTHEDLRANQGGNIFGDPAALGMARQHWRNHGTAVIGVIGGDRTPFGVLGISPDANVSGASIGGFEAAQAIGKAVAKLRAGDIILLELHYPGPRHNFSSPNGQRGYIAIEWWPHEYDVIRAAVAKGIIVVEAAGNGAENLDDALYDRPALGFPHDWANPFRRGHRDSGAILIGAGAPPPGTHGQNWGPDRSRLDFSNHGSAVDAQGWGREVTTCGYGDLQGGHAEDYWYTRQFSGTSSASPIVVGALACIQGMLRAANRPLLNSISARELLRRTGAPQGGGPNGPMTQRIGNRPDIRAMARDLGL